MQAVIELMVLTAVKFEYMARWAVKHGNNGQFVVIPHFHNERVDEEVVDPVELVWLERIKCLVIFCVDIE
jgi:hypothetical protein